MITFQTTSGFTTKTIAILGDFLLWFARDKAKVKVRKLYEEQPLVLGEGNDLVIVENGSGTTEIADFAAGDASGDQIDVSAFFSTFADLDAANDLSGSDVVIALDHNDTLVLVSVQLSTLNVDDFLFV